MLAAHLAKLRRRTPMLRYAINAASAVNQQEALRNYLLMVSRAHGLHPGRQNLLLPQQPTFLDMLHAALEGDSTALGMGLDFMQDATGEATAEPHELVGDWGGTVHPRHLLAGLHHRTLGTGFHGQPLDIARMFSQGGLLIPRVRQRVNAAASPLTMNMTAQQMQGVPRADELPEMGRVLQHTQHPVDLVHMIDLLHHLSGHPQVHTAVQNHLANMAHTRTSDLRGILGELENYHGVGG